MTLRPHSVVKYVHGAHPTGIVTRVVDGTHRTVRWDDKFGSTTEHMSDLIPSSHIARAWYWLISRCRLS